MVTVLRAHTAARPTCASRCVAGRTRQCTRTRSEPRRSFAAGGPAGRSWSHIEGRDPTGGRNLICDDRMQAAVDGHRKQRLISCNAIIPEDNHITCAYQHAITTRDTYSTSDTCVFSAPGAHVGTIRLACDLTSYRQHEYRQLWHTTASACVTTVLVVYQGMVVGNSEMRCERVCAR
eukprot:5550672-Prymnesium_polylepis.1